MTQRQIEDLLSQQADRLVAAKTTRKSDGQKMPGGATGGDPTSLERAGLSQEEQRALNSLMHLARRVQAVLVEVEPRPAFITDLKARLVKQERAKAQPAATVGRGMLWVWGVAGALSLAGLGFLGYRAARAGWLSGRNARAALPKA